MTPIRFLRAFIVSFILFVLLDAFWHGGIMADFYNQRLMILNPLIVDMPIGLSPFMLLGSAINAIAITYLILAHFERSSSLAIAAWIGALLGLTVVATLNLVNHVLIPGWDITLAIVDTAWGTCMGIVGAVAVTAVAGPEERRGLWGWLRRMVRRS